MPFRSTTANGGATRQLARLKTIALLAAGMIAAAAVMYEVCEHELRDVAAGASVGTGARTIILTILAIMAGFSVLCIVGFSRVIFGPLRELNQVISRRAAGDRNARLHWSRMDEIGAIGRNFDSMVDTINEGEERLLEYVANTVRALALAVDAKDPFTHDHSKRVALYASALGNALELPSEHVERLYTSAILHDVGKIGVPDAILLSPGRLSAEEFAVMKQHAADGERLVAGAGMSELAHWIRHHHERFDGCGYPDGLAGLAIPLEGRILAVADSFEALTSDRLYRAALGVEEAIAELDRCAGTQFDPGLVSVFVSLVRAGRLDVAEVVYSHS
jgi:HD-GYP domain-containing protein (c-di-GMP phosphodiesterase class II)